MASIWLDVFVYLSADIICSEMQTSFPRVKLEEQIMFKDKYMNAFSHQMEAIMVIILQIFVQQAGKCLLTTFCLLHGMFTFQCSLA